jgi:hypothetical protein
MGWFFDDKANAEASQRGMIGAATGLSISTIREWLDYPKNIYIKGLPKKESEEDSKKDWEANLYGVRKGLLNPDEDAVDLVKKYRPAALRKKYW